MAERRPKHASLERVLGTGALFSTAYGNVGSSIYYALGLVAIYAAGMTPVVFVIAGLIFAATAASYAEATTMYPEAGGSSSFARRAFNEFWSFFAAWGQMLTYIITISISAFFVPHYLGVFWSPLGEAPADIFGGVVVVVLLGTLSIVGVKESAGVNIGFAVADFLTQVLLVGIGIVLVFDPDLLIRQIDLGTVPTVGDFLIAIPVAMVAYTGIETISNMAEEARDYGKTIPRGMGLVVAAVAVIYTFLPAVALSAMPVEDRETVLALPKEEGGYADDPVLGVVTNMDLGSFEGAAEIYVGILAATILFIATHAGVATLRVRRPDAERPWKGPFNVTVRGYELPLYSILGGLGTGIALVVATVLDVRVLISGVGWMAIGVTLYVIYRRRQGLKLTETHKIVSPKPAVEHEVEYESVLVAFEDSDYSPEAVSTAVRLAARRRRGIHVLVTITVPPNAPINASLPEQEAKASSIIDSARVRGGRRVTGHWEKVRPGQAGRRVVEEANEIRARAVVMPLPPRRTGASLFGRTLETVLQERPCRVIIDSTPKATR